MHVPRVHHNHRPGADAFGLSSIQVIAVAVGNDADRERLMRVLGVADLSAVLYGSRFDERKRVITPEPGLSCTDCQIGHVVVSGCSIARSHGMVLRESPGSRHPVRDDATAAHRLVDVTGSRTRFHLAPAWAETALRRP